jgi:aryl-alcohol dehydrogenase-like predicted oxidoreductase
MSGRDRGIGLPEFATDGENILGIDAAPIQPYVKMGASGLVVYRVGLGTMQFGWTVDEPGAIAVMDAYVEAGGNFIDTADCYSAWSASMSGPPNPGGVSEEIIGRWLTKRGNRDDMVIATKVRAPMGENFCDTRGTVRQREGLSRRWIIRSCEDSLKRLGVDHIDLYQAHFFDPLVPIEETLSAFTDLVRQGKVRYLGCSNFSAWRLMESLWASDRKGLESFVSVQPEYSLLSPTRGDFETEIAQVCEAYGIGVIPYSPLAGGVLTGKYRRGQPLPASFRADENDEMRLNERNWEIIETLVSVAEQSSMTPAQAAIQWMRSKPFVTSPIIGANTPGQLNDVLSGLDRELPAEAVAELDRVSDFHRSRSHKEE